MKRYILILCGIVLPTMGFSQFTVQELKTYLETEATKDSSIIVDTWEDQHFQGEFIQLKEDTLVFKNIITRTILQLPLGAIEFVRTRAGEYYFDGEMYREAQSPGSSMQSQKPSTDTTQSANVEIPTPTKSRTPPRQQSPQNLWRQHNPDGEIGVPYLLLRSGGHIRNSRLIEGNDGIARETTNTVINPSFNAGFILPASPRATLELMYQYDYRTFDNGFTGFSTKESDHFVYLQMKIKLGK